VTHGSGSRRAGTLAWLTLASLALAGCAGGQIGSTAPAPSSRPVQVRSLPSSVASASAGSAAPRTTRRPAGARLAEVHDPGRVTGTLTGPCHARDRGRLPDRRCTPGAVDPAVTQVDIRSTICSPGYTETVRPPEGQTEAFKSNLWPEAGALPNPKDAVEDALNRAVCGGQVSLARAQRAIARDWETAESRLGLGAAPPAPGPAPTVSAHAVRCRASVSTASPPDYTTVDVYVRTAAGASVAAVAHYKTTDHELTAIASGAGLATVAYYISGATPGFTVAVDVTASAGGRTATCSTAFTPAQ
jgi:hypothetical protein